MKPQHTSRLWVQVPNHSFRDLSLLSLGSNSQSNPTPKCVVSFRTSELPLMPWRQGHVGRPVADAQVPPAVGPKGVLRVLADTNPESLPRGRGLRLAQTQGRATWMGQRTAIREIHATNGTNGASIDCISRRQSCRTNRCGNPPT